MVPCVCNEKYYSPLSYIMANILYTICISFLIICLADQLIQYVKEHYTTKKTKDVMGHHIHKYQSLIEEFQENKKKDDLLSEDTSIPTKLTESELHSLDDELDAFISASITQ